MARTPPPDPRDISQAREDLFYPVEQPECMKCHDTGMITQDGYIERSFCDCPQGQALQAELTQAGNHDL